VLVTAFHAVVAVVAPVAAAVNPVGTGRGTTAVEEEDTGPAPLRFLALTRNMYDVLFVSPVTVVEVAIEIASANTDQVVPELDENSIV
jgi:hypothetical protein